MTEHITPVDFQARLAGLRDRLTGHAFLPGEDGYAEETSSYNLMTPLRPRVAVRAASVADVQAAVRFAAENDLGVAVRGGGHIVAKQDPNILVVSLRQMRAVSVVPDRRRVTFEGGALWQDLKMGVEHLRAWKRIALVTDIEWMSHLTSLFGWMTPGDTRVFGLEQRDAAVAWAAS